MNLQELREKYRDDILKITSKYGVTNVRVFGSVARGDAGKNSDVDLLATYPDTLSLLGLVGLEREIQEKIGFPVEMVSDEAINHYLKENILKEATPL